MEENEDGVLECGASYTFTEPDQFWSELAELLSIAPDAPEDQLDYALRSYIAFLAHFMDEYLSEPSALDSALFALLESPLFTSHEHRQSINIISTITPLATAPQLFISLMLILHLGLANPLSPSSALLHSDASLVGGAKVFKLMRKRWKAVVPTLMKWVGDASVGITKTEEHKGAPVFMPAEGWEERVGTSATSVLYEVCRVQRLSAEELGSFSYEFIEHLFSLVERTRDAEDETFNYTLIKLIIALNEQFMVATVQNETKATRGLPPPILPTIVGPRKAERDPNLVLEALRESEESKTFGENIIFILNRSNGTPDSLCVSLLILKILYLLFTTSGTQEYFFTNDLCVLVDVFIRELCDLGEESEGLKHTYLRVLHPLLNNTQLRHHPYKRPQLRRVLVSLISNNNYREVDSTTRRLVERNLRGTWCDGLTDASVGEEEVRRTERKMSASGEYVGSGTGWSSGMGRREVESRLGGSPTTGLGGLGGWGKEKNASSLSVASNYSVDAVAKEEGRPIPAHRRVAGDSPSGKNPSRQASGSNSPLTNSVILEREEPPQASTEAHHRFTTALFPPEQGRHTHEPEGIVPQLEQLSCSPTESIPGRRRRAPPPPPGLDVGPSRPRTPLLAGEGSPVVDADRRSPAPGTRRKAPEPPSAYKKRVQEELTEAVAPYAR